MKFKSYCSFLSLAILFVSQITLGQNQRVESNASHSVLASGKWRKLGITSRGVYKIDRSRFESYGFDAGSIDPRNIRIYGNGGGMLPQPNSDFRYDDLEENHIEVVGEEDGKFDGGDYILFYAQGPHETIPDVVNEKLTHQFNIYSDTNYYFLTVADSAGLRIEEKANLSPKSSNIVSTYDEYKYHESDQTNVLGSGREWYGESFKFYTEHDFSFTVSGVVPGSTFELTSVMMAQSRIGSTTFTLSSGSQAIGTQTITKSTSETYGTKGRETTKYFDIPADNINSSSLPIRVSYDNNGDNAADAYVNKLALNFQRELTHYGEQNHFSSFASLNDITTTYEVASISSAAQIWDITIPEHPMKQAFEVENGKGVFTCASDSLKRFILLNGRSFKTPTDYGNVRNQDLHGIVTPPELLIVTHSKFVDMANDLADFKRNEEGYTVEVITTGKIYNEFGSGRQDITAIRDFTKMLYDRGSGSDSLRFLLLIGDCSFDYKNREDRNNNYVPTYQSYESLVNTHTYCSDDYYGFLQNSKGVWSESPTIINHRLDIGVGRFPINSNEEGQIILQKLTNYITRQSSMNKWRNTICYVADDGDDVRHMREANDLAKQINTTHPEYLTTKIFLGAYDQVSSAGGQIAPVVNTALNTQIDKGALIVNYTGHGAEEVWAQEKILTLQQVKSYDNSDRLPLFVTATCEFGRHDDPSRRSGAELLFLNENGGGIALLTTSRPVYSSSNLKLNTQFYNEVFKPKADGTMPTIGEVLIETKNNSFSGVLNRNFVLLGDPSMRLAYPKKNVVVQSINGDTINNMADTVKALGVAEIAGFIENYDGSIDQNFNGELYITVFDKQTQVTTAPDEKTGNTLSFSTMTNVLYEGVASISNGEFSVSFVVPKDISYQFDFGKISLYAKHSDMVDDANGYYDNIVIGGTDENAVPDNTPPTVQLYMDDTSFINGGTTGTEALFLAHIEDDNGVNIATTGIGHEITAYLDGNDEEVIILNEFYVADLDDYTSGWVSYDFDELSPGKHTITFKVWDTHNNSTEVTIDFWVGTEFSVVNYPNPVSDYTTFEIDQIHPGEDVEISISIIDSQGMTVRELFENHFSSTTRITLEPWEGDNAGGNRLSPGIYFYRATLNYVEQGHTISKKDRLVIAN